MVKSKKLKFNKGDLNLDAILLSTDKQITIKPKRKRRKKVKKEINILCRYCKNFFISPINDERTSTKERKCVISDLLVTINSKICDKFIPNDIFWCDKDNHWQYTRVCTTKITRRIYGCYKCNQGKVVLKLKKEFCDE